MRLVILAAALALPAASFAQPPRVAPSPNIDKFAGGRLDCMSSRVQHARPGAKARFNRLGELPSGDLQLAVVRQVDGCQEPVVVRQGYGALAGPESRRR